MGKATRGIGIKGIGTGAGSLLGGPWFEAD